MWPTDVCGTPGPVEAGDDAGGCLGDGLFALIGDCAVGAALLVAEAFVAVRTASLTTCRTRIDRHLIAAGMSLARPRWVDLPCNSSIS